MVVSVQGWWSLLAPMERSAFRAPDFKNFTLLSDEPGAHARQAKDDLPSLPNKFSNPQAHRHGTTKSPRPRTCTFGGRARERRNTLQKDR